MTYWSNGEIFITLSVTKIHQFDAFITPNKNEKLGN